jgi:ligand-binding SRPBCC domain-containing protein
LKIIFRTPVATSMQQVKLGFNRDLFEALSPPWVKVHLQRFDGCKVSHEVHLEIQNLWMRQKWVSVITAEESNERVWSFTDEGRLLPWPLTFWKHIHRVEILDDNSSLIIDDITFGCRSRVLEVLIFPFLWGTFAVRPRIYKKIFKGSP